MLLSFFFLLCENRRRIGFSFACDSATFCTYECLLLLIIFNCKLICILLVIKSILENIVYHFNRIQAICLSIWFRWKCSTQFYEMRSPLSRWPEPSSCFCPLRFQFLVWRCLEVRRRNVRITWCCGNTIASQSIRIYMHIHSMKFMLRVGCTFSNATNQNRFSRILFNRKFGESRKRQTILLRIKFQTTRILFGKENFAVVHTLSTFCKYTYSIICKQNQFFFGFYKINCKLK